MKARIENLKLIFTSWTTEELHKLKETLTWFDDNKPDEPSKTLLFFDKELQSLYTYWGLYSILQKIINLEVDNVASLYISKDRVEVPKNLLGGITLLDFQRHAIQKGMMFRIGAFEIPTGGGKTEIMLGLLKSIQFKKTLIIVPTVALCDQFVERALERGFNSSDFGKVSGGRKELDKRVIVCVINSVYNFIKSSDKEFFDVLDEIDILMYDECFPQNTKILLLNGQFATIKEVYERSDITHVLSYNVEKRILEPKKIIRKIRNNYGKTLFNVLYKTPEGVARKIVTTKNHKIFTKNKGYVRLDELKIGDEIVLFETFKEEIQTFDSHTCEIVRECFSNCSSYSELVYNLEVEDNHNYIADGVLVSNCHHLKAVSWQSILQKTTPKHLFFFTGTLFNDSEDPLSNYKDTLVYGLAGNPILKISLSHLTQIGLVAQPHLLVLKTSGLTKFYPGRYHVIYNNFIVRNKERNDKIVSLIESFLGLGFPCLVLVQRREHAEILLQKLSIEKKVIAVFGGKDGIIYESGSLVDVEIDYGQVGDNVRSGHLKCIIATQVFDEGVDIPGFGAVLLVGAGKSRVKHLQRFGRGLRRKSGINRVYFIDFEDRGHIYLKSQFYKRKAMYMESGVKIYYDKEIFFNLVRSHAIKDGLVTI